jgi:predicted nucleotidyltransferase
MLGSVGAVRVLRLLSQLEDPVAPSILSHRSGLTRAAVGRVLQRLQTSGVVEPVGSSPRPYYRLVPGHPIGVALRTLFEAEAARADGFLQSVGKVAEQHKPVPVAVWLYGSAVRGRDRPDSDVDLMVVVADHATARKVELTDDLNTGAAEAGVILGLTFVSKSELPDLVRANQEFWSGVLREAVVLYGVGPSQLI